MLAPLDLAQTIVRRALKAGAEEAEVYYEDRRTTSVEVREQQVESLTSAETRGLGLRVLVGGAMSYLYTPEFRPRSLVELARRAVALAREASPDPDRRLPDHDRAPTGGDLKIFDPTLVEVTPDRKIDLLRAVERAARAEDVRVRSTEVARYTDIFGTVALANSRGLAASYERSFASAVLAVVAADDGEALTGYGYDFGRSFETLSPERIGRLAARRAVKPLGGRPVPTQKATVVLEPEVATGFLGQIAQALRGDAVVRGRSMYTGKLGERVGSDLVTIVDHGSLPAGPRSTPFDGEGVPTGRSILIEGGVLRGLLHNTYTARRAGAASTGNAVRQGYRGLPDVDATNFALEAPAVSRDALLADVQRGLLVLTTRNVGGINPVNGDFSVGAAGVWIEHGQETGPVASVTIAANMHDMLAGLVAVSDDFHWSPGGIGCGNLRIEGMTIAGR